MKVKFHYLPDLKTLRSLFNYDPEAGTLSWKVQRGRSRAGDPAGSLDVHGYLRVRVFDRLYYVHRIAYFMSFGIDPENLQIDHKDMDRSNNRIENLRIATQPENMWNTKSPITNTSGYKGVAWNKTNQAWYGEIKKNGIKYRTPGCPTAEIANCLLLELRRNLHKNFANHG